MKMFKLVLMALLATGTVFAFTGCGDKKDDAKEEDKAEKKASDPAKELVDKFLKGVKDKDLKAVQSYLPEDDRPKSVDDLKEVEEMFSSFKYEKTVKVNDKYSLVCGTITDEEGNTKFAFHVKDRKIVDFEDNWEPKAEKKASDSAKELVDKFLKGVKDKDLKAVQSYLPEDDRPKSVGELKMVEEIFSSFKYEKTVKVNDKYSLVCGTITDEEGNTKFAFHVKNGKIVDIEDNWKPKDEYK